MSEIDKYIPISKFATFVNPFAHDIASNVIEQCIREAVIWFCRESRILRDYYTIKCQKNVIDYPIILPKDREIIGIENIDPYGYAYKNANTGSYKNASFYPNAYARNDVHYRTGGPMDAYGSSFFKLDKDGVYPVIIIEAAITNCNELEIVYSWTIKRDGCEIPNIIYEEYVEVITAYAVHMLCLMSDKVSDLQKAQYWQAKRDSLLDDALYKIAKRYINDNGKFRTSPFVAPSLIRRSRRW